MTLLSLFMTSTGIFCFIPISQRLIESGIIPTSSSWRLRRPLFVLAQNFDAHNEEKIRFLLAADKVGDPWSEVEKCHQMKYTLPHIPLYSPDDAFDTDQHPIVLCANGEWSAGAISPHKCSPSLSTSFDTFYGHESASFISDSTLCDSCNALLRREIPPDHIPSVIRAFSLFEAQDRLSDVDFDECEVVSLTSAFSMLRL